MKHLLALLVSIATVLAVANTASAFYFGYADSSYRFEVYTGNTYTYAPAPYTYLYDNYYYFDFPFRVYSGTNYYYFPSGWYDFSPAFMYAPYSTVNYTYYPANYYYYNSGWTYSPGWLPTYGPMFYGNYYFPPQPTLVGQQFKPTKEADCSEVKVAAHGISVSAGDNRKVSFSVANNSDKWLDVQDVFVYVDGFDAGARNVKFDKTIASNSMGKIEFEVFAAENAKGSTANAKVQVTGTFRDGTSCGLNDIEEKFSVSVSGSSGTRPRVEIENRFTGNAFYNPSGSTSFTRARETQQKWVDVVPAKKDYATTTTYPTPQTYAQTMQAYRPAAISATNTQTDRPTTQVTTARTTTADFSGYSAGSNTITTSYGEKQVVTQSCDALSMSTENISVEAGKESKNYFVFRDYAGEDFFIDRIDAIEYSPGFAIEAFRENPRVFAGQTGVIKVNALAREGAEDETASAHLEVEGHFGSGFKCKLSSGNFFVKVRGEQEQALDEVKVSVPPTLKLAGSSGFIEINFENPTGKEVRVVVHSNEVLVEPSEVFLPARTNGKRIIAVNGFEENKARINYEIRENGVEELKKYTVIVKIGAGKKPGEVKEDREDEADKKARETGQDKDATAEKKEGSETGDADKTGADANAQAQGTVKRITNLAGAGLSVLSQNALMLGLVILTVIIVALFVLKIAANGNRK